MRKTLSNKEKRELNDISNNHFAKQICSKSDIVVREDDFVFINNVLSYFYDNNVLIPLLTLLQTDCFLKKIVIDMPAVQHIINKADVMRPGIKEIDNAIACGDPVAIVDETHHKPIAVGIALYSGAEMKNMKIGKVIRTIHAVGDFLWKKASS